MSNDMVDLWEPCPNKLENTTLLNEY